MHILHGMDLKAVRLAVARGRERLELTQSQLAARAGLQQGHISKIEDVDQHAFKDLSARILFQVIEQGLGILLSDFFRQIESRTNPDRHFTDPLHKMPPSVIPRNTSARHEPSAVSAHTSSVDAHAFGRFLIRLGETLADTGTVEKRAPRDHEVSEAREARPARRKPRARHR